MKQSMAIRKKIRRLFQQCCPQTDKAPKDNYEPPSIAKALTMQEKEVLEAPESDCITSEINGECSYQPSTSTRLSLNHEYVMGALHRYYESTQPSIEHLDGQRQLLTILSKQVALMGKGLGLEPYGSALSGLMTNDSDIDLTVVQHNKSIKKKSENVLPTVHNHINKKHNADESNLSTSVHLGHAKIPIIKCEFIFNHIEYKVDIGVHNEKAVANSILLQKYISLDERVPLLLSLVKNWAKNVHIHGGYHRCFNSYTLNLMVIYYLQNGIQPPLLPNLHKMFPECFDDEFCNGNVGLARNLHIDYDSSSQTKSAAELIVGFMLFYNEFDFRSKVISISTLQEKDDLIQGEIKIKDPCKGENPARNLSSECYFRFKKELHRWNQECLLNFLKRPIDLTAEGATLILSLLGIDKSFGSKPDYIYQLEPTNIFFH